jgi:hypothetical protein
MRATSGIYQTALGRTFDDVREAREAFRPQLTLREVGIVKNVSTGVAIVSGLPGVGFYELIRFAGDLQGIAFNVDEDEFCRDWEVHLRARAPSSGFRDSCFSAPHRQGNCASSAWMAWAARTRSHCPRNGAGPLSNRNDRMRKSQRQQSHPSGDRTLGKQSLDLPMPKSGSSKTA